jgi:hypothetical protein
MSDKGSFDASRPRKWGWCPVCGDNRIDARLDVVVLLHDPLHDAVTCPTCQWWTVFSKQFWDESAPGRGSGNV